MFSSSSVEHRDQSGGDVILLFSMTLLFRILSWLGLKEVAGSLLRYADGFDVGMSEEGKGSSKMLSTMVSGCPCKSLPNCRRR